MTELSAPSLRSLDCRPGQPKLADPAIAEALQSLPGWSRSAAGDAIQKTYPFSDFYRTMAFVNAVAWIANQQDHHPDLDVRYNRCGVTFSTHDAGGVTLNDLICAARVEALGG
jgi:4a-hydroxytetrahydrobiopterin dehydratase